MEISEMEALVSDLYLGLELDPARPPGPFRIAVLLWGAAVFRYVASPRPDPKIDDGCWELELPTGAKSDTMTVRIAVAIARWIARRQNAELDADDEHMLSLAILMPGAAMREDVLKRGLTATEIGALFGVDASLVATRVARMLAHGSGERPSAAIRAARKA